MKSLLKRFSKHAGPSGPVEFKSAPEGGLFPATNPADDGEECMHDCDSCTIRLPSKFKIDEDDKLYGQIKGWETHLVVATGKSDWVRDVEDEKHSVMEAVGQSRSKITNGRLMLSASNIPLPDTTSSTAASDTDAPTRCLLLPAFTWIENVRPSDVPELITSLVNHAPTNSTPLATSTPATLDSSPSSIPVQNTIPKQPLATTSTPPPPPAATPADPLPTLPFKLTDCPHRYLILLCSQKTRDARCGQSAPLLRREFERHLRPLGLYRDLTDERPGGAGIYFISHVGGHKYSANVLIYRRAENTETPVNAAANGNANGNAKLPSVAEQVADPEVRDAETANGSANGHAKQNATAPSLPTDTGFGEAAQCIWIARVRPEDCENIVRYTLLQGKVVKPASQLRGGFDRKRNLVSW